MKCNASAYFAYTQRYAQIWRMKNLLIIIPIVLFILGCTSQSYLQLAENEINEKIEKSLFCNNSYFYNDLEEYFEQYLIQNDLIKDNDKIENGYYNYLKYLPENGVGINNIENIKTTQDLKNKLQCAGYNLTSEQNNLFLYKCFEPVVTKYKSELSHEKEEDELIYRFGMSDPNEEVSLMIVNNGLLKQYKPNDFKRPLLKKFVVLYFFVQLEM